jgi:signal peptidase I
VQCCDAEGRVTVDGQPLDEPYVYEDTPLESRAFDAVTVPEGRLWVMGDHRSASADSRSHVGDRYSGTVAVDDVIGKAALIVWPMNRFGTLDDPDIQDVEASAAPPSGAVGTASPVGSVLPLGAGLVGALPVTVWHRRRRLRRAADR